MADIVVTSNSREIQRQLTQLPDAVARRVAARALNRTLTSTKAKANRVIRSELSLKAGDVNKLIRVRRARPGVPEAGLRVQAKRVGLGKYKGTRQTRKGVSVRPKKKRSVIKGAFVATMRSGHRGVFERKGVGSKRVGRLPIRELFSSHPAQVLGDEANRRRVVAHARDRLETELSREIEFRLNSL